MTQPRQDIPITETWTRTDWQNFDVNQILTSGTTIGDLGTTQYPFGLSTQKHINVRNFSAIENWEIIAVGELLPMEGLFPSPFVFPGGGLDATGTITTDPSPAFNNWPMATMAINPGTNVYVNVVAESIYAPVDLTAIESNAELTVALPSFPLADIDLANSYLGLSSDAFTANQILLPWSASTVAPTNGHTRLSWPYSAIAGQVDSVDLTRINGIVLFITATLACTVRFMALRMIHEQWVQTNVDFNTLTNHLTQCIPLNGDPAAVNPPGNQNLPILWRSAEATGPDDPRPIDAEISAEFNTGTALNNLTQTQSPQGNWIGTYGSDGYYLPAFNGGTADISSLPFFSTVTPSGGTRFAFALATTETRALQDPTGTYRNATTYYSATSETIQFTAAQDYNGTMSVYCVDWDGGNTRSQTLQCQGQTATLTSFSNGAWVTFAISVSAGQSVTLTLTKTGALNAVVSGIFFGGGPATNGSCAIYMRGQSQAFITQLDLQNQTQDQLSGKPQPTLGVSTRTPRTMADLERYAMGGLDAQTMLNLEAMEDIVTTSWVKFLVQWGNAPMVQITDSADPNEGYQYTNVRLASATNYLMVGKLAENAARLWIYRLDSHKAISTLVFDSGLIPDRSQFPRYKGRIGFQASLGHDAYVGAIRPRGLMFAEYRSAALNSITPVSGTRLFADQTPDTALWQEWTPFADQAGNIPLLSADTTRSTTGSSTAVKITNTSSTPQGIATNWLTPGNDSESGITDFNNFEIEFDLWFPSAGFQSTGQNLCSNPSFEYDANSTAPANWASPSFSASGATGTFVVQTGWVNQGVHSLRLTGTGVSSHGTMFGGFQNYVSAIQGLAYSAEIVVNVLSASTSGQITIDFYDKNNAHLSGVTNTGTGAAGVYTLTLTNKIAPPNAAFVNVSWGLVNQSGGSATVDAYIDSVMLVQASTLPSYFDGDTPGYAWAGIPGKSISVTGQPLVAQLVSADGAVYPIDLPKLIPDQWQHFDLEAPLPAPVPQSGLYQFVLNYYGVPAGFWIDGEEIAEESIQWAARSVTSDAWHSNYAPWTKFTDADDLLNSDTSGVRFSTQGTQLQMRGQALKQNAAIFNAPKVIPKYAQLGRLVWPEDLPNTISVTSATVALGQSSAGSNNAGIGTVAWTNPNNIGTPGSYATFASSTNAIASNYLYATNFGLSVPGTATIIGIVVSIMRLGTQTLYPSLTGIGNTIGGINDASIQLIKSGALIAPNYAKLPSSSHDLTAFWSTTPAMAVYGHANDLWNNNWLPFEINTMGVALAAQTVTGSGVTQTASADYVTLNIFYQPSGTTAYAPGVVVKSTNVGRTFTFDGTSSVSVQAPIGNWYWSFGDGTFDSGPHSTHTYQYPGTYIPTLTVTDGYGNANTGWQVVNVS